MLVYASYNGKLLLTADQYNELSKLEFQKEKNFDRDHVDSETVEEYRQNDSDFIASNFDYLNDFGGFDIYTRISDNRLDYDGVLIKYHENINQRDKILNIRKIDTPTLLQLSDDYDNAKSMAEKGNALLSINNLLGISLEFN